MIKLTGNGSNGEHVDGKRFVVPDRRKNRHLGEVLLQAVGNNLEINLFTEDSGNFVRSFDNDLCNWGLNIKLPKLNRFWKILVETNSLEFLETTFATWIFVCCDCIQTSWAGKSPGHIFHFLLLS